MRLSSTTVKCHPDSFTSGGMTSMPSARHSAMYGTTFLVSPMAEERSAAMNSAG